MIHRPLLRLDEDMYRAPALELDVAVIMQCDAVLAVQCCLHSLHLGLGSVVSAAS